MRYFLLFIIMFAFLPNGSAQDNVEARLAQRYYQEGQYEKAAELYKKLYNGKDGVSLYYQSYFMTLVALRDFEALEDMIQKAIRQSDNDLLYLLDRGYVLREMGDERAGLDQYEQVLGKLRPDPFAVSRIAGRFMYFNEQEYALKAYLRGKEMLNDPSALNYEIGYAYYLNGDIPRMMEYYLEDIKYRPERVSMIQNEMQRNLSEDKDYELLETLLLKKVARESQSYVYEEMLVWLYLQVQDYNSALIQARSLDIKNVENGRRLVDLAREAAAVDQFDVAIKAYQHVIDKGPQYELYVTASLEMINVKRDKTIHQPDYSEEDLISLRNSYHRFIQEYPPNYTTAYATIELARLEAFYIHDLDTAISLLTGIIEWPRLHEDLLARAKLDLGDYYLLTGEVWEPTLLYSQVEKAFRGSPVAEEARFKNAQLSYYKGDFEWAQTQLKLLKASTSELVANDALDLSIFIADNFNLDTSEHPMMIFARADLLAYQNRLDEAESELDALLRLYPGHSLTDDIYFKKAEIGIARREYEEAANILEGLVKDFGDGLLADNALFLLGDIYMNYLEDKEKASGAYERIILDYKGSILAVEARKRFRALRGDQMSKEELFMRGIRVD